MIEADNRPESSLQASTTRGSFVLMPEDNKRGKNRVPADIKVDYRTVGTFVTDYTANLSHGGLFVRTSLPFDPGERVRLRVTIPGQDLPFPLEGVVRWNRKVGEEGGDAGMGIEFVDFSTEMKQSLEEFVATLKPDDS